MSKSLPEPLGGPAPHEVPLARLPLIRAIAQVRFASVLRIGSLQGIANFQEKVRGNYPLFEAMPSQEVQIDFRPNAPPILNAMPGTAWRFSDADREANLSLTTSAVTLECATYVDREAFLSRWTGILELVENEFSPGLALRSGVRYVNRIAGKDDLKRLSELVAPNLLGMAKPQFLDSITQGMSAAHMKVDEGQLVFRWGMLPPNMTIVPGLLPFGAPAWMLDIDVYSEAQHSFSSKNLAMQFRSLVERAYSVFRYSITAKGLKVFGAKL